MTVASRALRLVQIAFAVLFCVACAGVVFGFAALKPVLVRHGVYRELCDADAPSCDAQDLRLNYMFTLAATTTNVAALPVGMILDRIGPRWTSILGALVFAAGNIAFGLGQETPVDTYRLGFILLAIGGPLVFLPSFHLSNAFPEHSGLIMSFITGAFDVSSVPYLFYLWLDSGISGGLPIRTFFWAYTIIPVLIIVEQLTLAPAWSYRVEEFAHVGPPPPDEGILVTHEVVSYSDVDDSESSVADEEAAVDDIKHAVEGHGLADPVRGIMVGHTARQQMASRWFIAAAIFLCIHAARINYYIQTVHTQLAWYLDVQPAQALGEAFAVLLPVGGVFSVPLVGYLLDAQGSYVTTIVMLWSGLAYGILGLLHNVAAQWTNVAIFVVFRPLMYTFVNDFCAKAFGFETFGTVLGFAGLLSGVFGLVLRSLDLAVAGPLRGDYSPVNLGGIFAGLASSAALAWVIWRGALRTGRVRLEDPLPS
ncbi:MFS general substrate transporter [Exidia glandulosa HHB12029]|uniref:MFS general substrate transporter n=1 Tax=Exidia glandulosa HHB12029 TaxID=1314781 RepID=A0A165GHI9_EXIGL|nr:MFS general substrate transporter [Exidia glandulosa HHB12029]